MKKSSMEICLTIFHKNKLPIISVNWLFDFDKQKNLVRSLKGVPAERMKALSLECEGAKSGRQRRISASVHTRFNSVA